MINTLRNIEIKNVNGANMCFCSIYTAEAINTLNKKIINKVILTTDAQEFVNLAIVSASVLLFNEAMKTKADCMNKCRSQGGASYCFDVAVEDKFNGFLSTGYKDL